MDLWLTRRRGDRFHAVEAVPLHGFEDLFETDLAREGTDLRLMVEAGGQEVRVKGIVLPSFAELRRTGRARAIERRVGDTLTDLAGQLATPSPKLDAARTASARDAVSVLDALLRAKRPLTAIVAT